MARDGDSGTQRESKSINELGRDDIARVAYSIVRHRTWILVTTVTFGVILIAYSFVLRPVYTAQVSILPHSTVGTSGLLGPIASLVGSSIGGGDSSYEPLYSKILVSDRILDLAISRKWAHKDFARPASLFEIFHIAYSDSSDLRYQTSKLKRTLNNRVVDFAQNKSNGYMVLRVSAPGDGRFSAELANFLVARLDTFNRTLRSSKAAEQFNFIESRLSDVEMTLRASEGALTAFLDANRSYTASPQLMQKYGELEREVRANALIWVELRKQLELAGVERNKEVSSVDVLDWAVEPLESSQPDHFLYGAAGLLIGFVFAVLGLVVRSQVRVVRSAVRRLGTP